MAPVKPLTHRQRQALATRTLIVDTARTLFAENGYAATTIDGIAQHCGVAASTVYAIFGNKRGILRAIREAWHASTNVREIYQRANDAPDPRRRLELYAHATRRQWETGAIVLAIYTGAAAADPEAAAELEQALEGRRRNLAALLEAGALTFSAGRPLAEVQAIHLALTRPEVYDELVLAWGWTADAYEAWLAKALIAQFLPD